MSDPHRAPHRDRLGVLQIVAVFLSIYAIGALLVHTIFPLPPATVVLLEWVDLCICAVFLVEFFVHLYQAPSKRAYLKWGWIDLVASIPHFEYFRLGRIVRLIRLFHLLRSFRSTQAVVRFLFRDRAKSTFATVTAISLLLTIFSAVAILNLEKAENSNIHTPSDALWWAMVTITSVGYGDKYPVTAAGRVVGVFLMTVGVGFFGTLTAFMARMFMEPQLKTEDSELREVLEEVRALRGQVSALERRLEEPRGGAIAAGKALRGDVEGGGAGGAEDKTAHLDAEDP